MSKLPPVPSENRSPPAAGDAKPRDDLKAKPKPATRDPRKQGQQANTRQNTTHQGYQQDR